MRRFLRGRTRRVSSGSGSRIVRPSIIALCVRSSFVREISRFPSSSEASCARELLKSAHSGVVCPHEYDAHSTSARHTAPSNWGSQFRRGVSDRPGRWLVFG